MKCDHHTNEIDEYATNICESLDLAAQASLPKAGSSKQASQGGGNAGWNEYVKPFQDESLFVNGLWKAAGSPNNGDLFIMNRNAKMQYKYAVKRLKRATYKIQQNKFVEGLLNGSVNIFKEIKKFREQSKATSSTVDGVTGSDEISVHFAQII